MTSHILLKIKQEFSKKTFGKTRHINFDSYLSGLKSAQYKHFKVSNRPTAERSLAGLGPIVQSIHSLSGIINFKEAFFVFTQFFRNRLSFNLSAKTKKTNRIFFEILITGKVSQTHNYDKIKIFFHIQFSKLPTDQKIINHTVL